MTCDHRTLSGIEYPAESSWCWVADMDDTSVIGVITDVWGHGSTYFVVAGGRIRRRFASCTFGQLVDGSVVRLTVPLLPLC